MRVHKAAWPTLTENKRQRPSRDVNKTAWAIQAYGQQQKTFRLCNEARIKAIVILTQPFK